MTVQEKAKMLMSMIAHNERMCLTLREPPPGVENYTAALRHGLHALAVRYKLEGPLVDHFAAPMYYVADAEVCLRALRGYHQSGVLRDSDADTWGEGEDCYLEAIEEALQSIEWQYGAASSVDV